MCLHVNIIHVRLTLKLPLVHGNNKESFVLRSIWNVIKFELNKLCYHGCVIMGISLLRMSLHVGHSPAIF